MDIKNASVTQLEECLPYKKEAEGSSPSRSTKICFRCKVEKLEEEFNWKVRDVERMWCCRSCWRVYIAAHYHKNRALYKARNKTRAAKIRALLRKLKDFPCVDCKQSFPSYVMDFDHLKDKKFCLAACVAKYPSDEQIMLEVAKCDVVCANCHRIRTHKRRSLA
jgi:hypothetical protein